MQTLFQKTIAGVALLPLALVAITLAPAQAQRPVVIVHRAIQAKVLREASDRRHVEFLTTHNTKVSSRMRRVTGRGIFQRGRRKPAQRFTYHGNVDVYSGTLSDLGYNINR